jgi:hypothetical protein
MLEVQSLGVDHSHQFFTNMERLSKWWWSNLNTIISCRLYEKFNIQNRIIHGKTQMNDISQAFKVTCYPLLERTGASDNLWLLAHNYSAHIYDLNSSRHLTGKCQKHYQTIEIEFKRLYLMKLTIILHYLLHEQYTYYT